MGIGAPHEDTTTVTAADSPAALGSRHWSRGYTSTQPLPDLEDMPVFPIQYARRTSPLLHWRGPGTLSMGTEVPTGTLGLYRRLRNKRPPVQFIGCTRLNHRHHYRPCPLAPIAPLSAARGGGPSRKRKAYKCMRSRARPPSLN